MSVSLSIDGPGDAELISAVRGGDIDAYGELFARHVDAARRLARQLTGPADADDLVSDAFTKVLTVLQRGGGPDLAFRAYLLTAVRRLHVDKIRASSRLRPVDDLTPFDPGLPFQDTAVEGFENAAAARAFASLPERWQMVLWHTEVEQQKPADIAPLLGMSANSVSALAYRAREGLRQAFLSQHATDPDDVDCAWTRDHLGAYVRSGLSRRDSARVDDHLAGCRACAAVYLELTEVNSGLGALLAPLLLGAAGAGYLSSGGLGAGGSALSSGFAAAKTWAVAHASVTAVGGMVVAATAVLGIYTATQFGGHNAAEIGSPPLLSTTPGASSLPAGNGDRSPADRSDHSRSPVAGDSRVPSVPTQSAGPTDPSTTPSLTDASTAPSLTANGPSSEPTSSPSSEPTDPSTTPTDPTSSPTDPTSTPPVTPVLQITSTQPTAPKRGDTYVVTTAGGQGTPALVLSGTDADHPLAPCTAIGMTVRFDHAGFCVITLVDGTSSRSVHAARSAAQADGDPVTVQTIEVVQDDQAITFTSAAPTDAVVDGPTYDVAADAPGGTPTFSTSSAACHVDGTTVSFVAAGECTIDADQAGSQDFRAAATQQQTFDVAAATQTALMGISATSERQNGNGQRNITVTVTGLPEGKHANVKVTFPSSAHVAAQSDACRQSNDDDHVYDCEVTQAGQQFTFVVTVNQGRQNVTGVLTPEGDLVLDPRSTTTFELPLVDDQSSTSATRAFTTRTQV